MFSATAGGVFDPRLRQHENELLAPVAADEVRPPSVLSEDAGDIVQHGVTDLVAVRVVDLLEVVQVDEGDGQGRS